LEYNIHKERTDWTRFARGQSQTFKTLHGLKNKGVKVDLGMPDEMWDKPSAEITQLKSQCETFVEKHEDEIESWYQEGGDTPLELYICKKALKKKEQECLVAPVPKESSAEKDKRIKSKKEDKTMDDDEPSAEKDEEKKKAETNDAKKTETTDDQSKTETVDGTTKTETTADANSNSVPKIEL